MLWNLGRNSMGSKLAQNSALLYILQISLSMGAEPMDFLKNNSWIVVALKDLRSGSKRRSFPNLSGCEGYATLIYLFKVSWAWSWRAAITLDSWRLLVMSPDGFLNKIMARRHSNSVRSIFIPRNFSRASWHDLSSWKISSCLDLCFSSLSRPAIEKSWNWKKMTKLSCNLLK